MPARNYSKTSLELRLKPKQYLVVVFVFIALAATVIFATTVERNRIEQNLRIQVERDALSLLSGLESEINANVYLAHGLVAYVMTDPALDESKINLALKAIYQHGRHLRNIGLAPDNRLDYVYPLKGNEAALGLYYPDVPTQWPAVFRTIESRSSTLAGPVRLQQGGSGLINRTPVFLEDNSYWGMLSLVLDTDSLFNAAGIAEEVNGLRIALRGTDGSGKDGDVFLGDTNLFQLDVVTVPVKIPGGSWQMALLPSDGWQAAPLKLIVLESIGLFISALLALMVLGYQRGRLKIEMSQGRLRAFLDTTPDGVIVIDDKGVVCEFNPAAELIFGYEAKEVIGQTVKTLMPAVDFSMHDSDIGGTPSSTKPISRSKGRQVYGLNKEGREFPVEVTVGNTQIGENYFHVGVLRDISDRKASEKKLKQLATTDPLTGALNRRAFLEIAEDVFETSKRNNRDMSILMLDADHFKKINDDYGHNVGDRVLINLSALALKALRSIDKFCRFGGEEFVVLLPETGELKARQVAERLLETIRSSGIEMDNGVLVKVTVSIGIASINSTTEGLESIISQADSALYRAKSEGRDRWCN